MMRRVCRCWGSVAGWEGYVANDREWRVDLVMVVIYLSLVVWIFKAWYNTHVRGESKHIVH